MITDCPICRRQFRINAWQLSAAKGLVQCGFCGEQFNALERLHDKPLPVTELSGPESAASPDDIVDEPQFLIPGNTTAAGAVKDDVRQFLVSRVRHPPGDVDDGSLAGKIDTITDDEGLAIELLGQVQQRRSKWGTVLWTFGVLCLLLIFTAQLGWFWRDWVLSRYPDFQPLARKFCEKYQCELTRERDLSALVLINRDVRDHPRYAETLLVNATIENQSDLVQPYPRIRLTLFDTEGKISSYRIFSPADFLDKTIDIGAGMPARVPVHIVLELTGATDSAVSFEFNFF